MMMFVLIWSSNLQSMSRFFLDQSACLHDVEIRKSVLITYSHDNREWWENGQTASLTDSAHPGFVGNSTPFHAEPPSPC